MRPIDDVLEHIINYKNNGYLWNIIMKKNEIIFKKRWKIVTNLIIMRWNRSVHG